LFQAGKKLGLKKSCTNPGNGHDSRVHPASPIQLRTALRQIGFAAAKEHEGTEGQEQPYRQAQTEEESSLFANAQTFIAAGEFFKKFFATVGKWLPGLCAMTVARGRFSLARPFVVLRFATKPEQTVCGPHSLLR
jgi:hypothetical protein